MPFFALCHSHVIDMINLMEEFSLHKNSRWTILQQRCQSHWSLKILHYRGLCHANGMQVAEISFIFNIFFIWYNTSNINGCLTLSPLAVNIEYCWWPLQTIWIQMKPHKMWGFIWDPNYLTFRLYTVETALATPWI